MASRLSLADWTAVRADLRVPWLDCLSGSESDKLAVDERGGRALQPPNFRNGFSNQNCS
jgi:hypothetical protein